MLNTPKFFKYFYKEQHVSTKPYEMTRCEEVKSHSAF